MTFNGEPCQLVLMWLMFLPPEPCHSGGVLNKKDGKKPKPFDFGSRALSVGPNVVNNSPFRALLHWWHVYCSKIKKKDRQNLTLRSLAREPCQLVLIWLVLIYLKHCHTGAVCMVAKFEKRLAKPNPNDS